MPPTPRTPRRRSRPARAGTGRSRLSQCVAHSADGVQVARLALAFGLAPEVADVDSERVGARVEVVAPHAVQEELAGEDLARVAHEQLEEVELDPGQGERAPGPCRLAGAEVEREI